MVDVLVDKRRKKEKKKKERKRADVFSFANEFNFSSYKDVHATNILIVLNQIHKNV